MGNALKFTNSGSIGVKVNSIENEDHTFDINFSVVDTGIGISKEEHAKVFETFKQHEHQTTESLVILDSDFQYVIV